VYGLERRLLAGEGATMRLNKTGRRKEWDSFLLPEHRNVAQHAVASKYGAGNGHLESKTKANVPESPGPETQLDLEKIEGIICI